MYSSAAEDLINIMNKAVDEMEQGGVSPDQATIGVVAQSLYSLSTSLVEEAKAQGADAPGHSGDILINLQMVHGLLDTVVWMNDRLDLSFIDHGDLGNLGTSE